jgi:glycosyltransferase involved in cell wall biosynthesis
MVVGEPRLSVGLPVYNGERHLRRALDTLLSQEFGDFEVVVSDNASTDGTSDICREYAERDRRVRYHRYETNIGLFPNFNRAFALARAPYFKWATHDDWLEPSFLGSCVEVLDRDPSTVLCSTAVAVNDGDGMLLDEWRPPVDYATARPAERCARLVRTLGETYPMFGVIRSDALRRTSLLPGYLGCDRVLLAGLCLAGRVRILPDRLYHYTYYRPAARTYSIYNDPRNTGRLPLRTWRLCREHLMLISRSDMSPADKGHVMGAVLARFAVRDARRLAAEAYHSGRILVARARHA